MTTSPALFRLAARFDDVGFSDIVNIRNRVMELRASGATVYQFEGGEPYIDTPDFIKSALSQAVEENKTRYAPSSGIAPLRSAIAGKLRTKNRIPVKDEDVIVVTGGMQGLFGAFQSTIDPGDEVLLFSPFWTPIKDLVANCQGRTILVETNMARAEGFEKTLRRHLSSKTKAIYFNTPQNPTGLVFTRDEAEAVARFAREHDVGNLPGVQVNVRLDRFARRNAGADDHVFHLLKIFCNDRMAFGLRCGWNHG